MVGGVCFNAEIFILVIILTVVQTFLSCSFGELHVHVYDLLTAACIPMQLENCETIHRCLQIILLMSKAGNEQTSLTLHKHSFIPAQAKFFFLL